MYVCMYVCRYVRMYIQYNYIPSIETAFSVVFPFSVLDKSKNFMKENSIAERGFLNGRGIWYD